MFKHTKSHLLPFAVCPVAFYSSSMLAKIQEISRNVLPHVDVRSGLSQYCRCGAECDLGVSQMLMIKTRWNGLATKDCLTSITVLLSWKLA